MGMNELSVVLMFMSLLVRRSLLPTYLVLISITIQSPSEIEKSLIVSFPAESR